MSSKLHRGGGLIAKSSQHEAVSIAIAPEAHQTARTIVKVCRKPVWVIFVTTFLALQVLFMGMISHLFGSAYKDGQQVDNLHVLFVDYDKGVFGSMLRLAYTEMQGTAFPTMIEAPVSMYPTIASLKTEACVNSHWWAALYTHPGATDRLMTAISAANKAAEYNASNAVSYMWDGVRYAAFGTSLVASNLNQLILRANGELYDANSTIFEKANLSDPEVGRVLYSPSLPYSYNIQPTTQGTRIFINTVTVVMSSISQFFGAMSADGIHKATGMYARLSTWSNLGVRWCVSLIYSCMIAGGFTIIIFGFKETWELATYQWIESWLLTWFNCNINFLILDTSIGFLAEHWVPFFVLTWTMLNLSGTIIPPDLAPGFYKWTYALPSHGYWATQVTIFSRGCSRTYAAAFPVMILWWLVGLIGSCYSVCRRCRVTQGQKDAEARIRDT